MIKFYTLPKLISDFSSKLLLMFVQPKTAWENYMINLKSVELVDLQNSLTKFPYKIPLRNSPTKFPSKISLQNFP